MGFAFRVRIIRDYISRTTLGGLYPSTPPFTSFTPLIFAALSAVCR
jgi:hypothetical protein